MTFRKEEGTCTPHLSSVLICASQPASSFTSGLWCWYICKLTNLTVRASCCFLLSLWPGMWLCTLILQGHKTLRMTLNYFSHFLLVTSVSKFHAFFEVAWTRLLSDPTNHTYLTRWSYHCSDNRRCVLWTWINNTFLGHVMGSNSLKGRRAIGE